MRQVDVFSEDSWDEWLPELHWLLDYYSDNHAFSDTPEKASSHLLSYLRNAAYYPGRAKRAMHDIRLALDPPSDTTTVDYSEWVEYYADMVTPPVDRTWQDCLRAIVPHLAAFTANGEQRPPGTPNTSMEWKERFPNIDDLLRGAFFRDSLEYYGAAGWTAAVARYLERIDPDEVCALAREIDEMSGLGLDPPELDRVIDTTFGVSDPPPGSPHEWLRTVAQLCAARLTEIGYRREPGTLSSAYPPHDIRAKL